MSMFPANLVLLHMENCSKAPQWKRRWLGWFMGSSPICEGNVETLHSMSILILENYSNVKPPKTFHMFGGLSMLAYLRVETCTALIVKRLPESFHGLKHLNILDIGFCEELETLYVRFVLWSRRASASSFVGTSYSPDVTKGVRLQNSN
ncbi:hypothetical protein R1flu_026556 [Riccia fluitans]|uniref:Uncharacterized protein n=1 Tax=Riccia fluitans TaxID=41844 RepID=A0ABD1XH11_9MARC